MLQHQLRPRKAVVEALHGLHPEEISVLAFLEQK